VTDDGIAHRAANIAATPEVGLRADPWLRRLARIGRAEGLFDRIGARHAGLFVDRSRETLLVSFDRADRSWALREDGLPVGFGMVEQDGWSLLSVVSDVETWFRDPELARFFGALEGAGFLSRYGAVIFAGIGADCGFAASVFTRFAPGARALLAAPVATLDPDCAPFERRFRAARRLPFRGALGHGGRAVAEAGPAIVLYDPVDVGQAAQAALFASPNVLRLGLPYGGRDLSQILRDGGGMAALLRLLRDGTPEARAVRAALKVPCRSSGGTMLRRARAALVRDQPRRAACMARGGYALSGDPRLGALAADAEETARVISRQSVSA
jgi:hypothetical protein